MSVMGFLVMTLIIRLRAQREFRINHCFDCHEYFHVSTSFSVKAAILKKSVETQDLQFVLRAYISLWPLRNAQRYLAS
jgi:hypothetical protein